MRIAQPVATYRDRSGHLVYDETGRIVCLVQRRPGPEIPLSAIIGPHILLDLMITVTAGQWGQWAARMPGGEALC